MSQPQRSAAGQLRRVEQLAHECVELGQDPLAWNRHMLASLLPLVGGHVATVLRTVPDATGEPAAVFGLDLGWVGTRDRAIHYEQLVATNGFRQAVSFRRLMALAGAVVARCRAQLVPDTQWYRSPEFHEMRRPLGLDDLLAARLRWTPGGGTYVITLNRRLDQPQFGLNECRLLHEFCYRLLQFGRRLALQPVGIYNGLPHRLQAALRCLLDGNSEKQAADRLGLSRFTLHEYVCDLYRHFGVSSRPELLARSYRYCLWDSRFTKNAPHAGLPQRLRQTLDKLLDGDSEKQVALRLQLSQHTVHEYVTELYRRFDVHSRAQLLVVCRRGLAA